MQLLVKMNYPKEFLKDLMFGTVLRDIGMIKVSDLIVRSPRDLAKRGMGNNQNAIPRTALIC